MTGWSMEDDEQKPADDDHEDNRMAMGVALGTALARRCPLLASRQLGDDRRRDRARGRDRCHPVREEPTAKDGNAPDGDD